MTAKGELERLDQLGRNAAHKARHQNHWMNHARHKSHTARHAALGSTSRHKMPIVGRLALSVALFIVICMVLSLGFNVARPGGYSLGAVIVIEAVFYHLKRRRIARLRAQGIGLEAQLHDLKEQEFQLRYEEAKEKGDLDRFGKKGDT